MKHIEWLGNRGVILKQAEPGFAPKLEGKSRSLRQEAKSRGVRLISLKEFSGQDDFILIHQTDPVYFRGSEPFFSATTHARHNDKFETKQLLRAVGVPVPEGERFAPDSYAELEAFFIERIKNSRTKKFVLKPTNMNKGKGVAMDITSVEQLKDAYRQLVKYPTVIEEQIEGSEHRFLIAGGRVIAVTKRTPASVLGDGQRSVSQLIEQKNGIRKKTPGHKSNLIKVDNITERMLLKQGLNVDSVPLLGQQVELKLVSNVSQGGDSEDVTDSVHDDFITMVEKVWDVYSDRALFAVDLIAEDITKALKEQKTGVIEVNNQPMLGPLHARPTIGTGRNVAKPIIDYLFPETLTKTTSY